MLFYQNGSENTILTSNDIKEAITNTLEGLGVKQKILAIPPDYTRFQSMSGEITKYVYDYYGDKLTDIMPALGTHIPMSDGELDKMFPGVPKNIFRPHNWRDDIVDIGTIPKEYVNKVSENAVDYDIAVQINRELKNGGHDLILSIGQVVPHEVVGMANYNKNIFIGVGGSEFINKSHFVGAAFGMERIMGRADTPVRRVFNYASDNFAKDIPIVYILTVIGQDNNSGKLVMRGLFIGDDIECFNLASDLSFKVNFEMLPKQSKKMVVYLDPSKYKTTWLGNKAIYRTRMAIADDGELIVIAPGVKEFGEDKGMDTLIRKYGYIGREKILEITAKNDDLKQNLGAAAHLIHGSSDGRFKITYCTKPAYKDDIEGVGFNFCDVDDIVKKYDPNKLNDGYNMVDGEEIFYISNPGLGLWASKDRFKD